MRSLIALLLVVAFAPAYAGLIESLESPKPGEQVRIPVLNASDELAVPEEVRRLTQSLNQGLQQVRRANRVYAYETFSPHDRIPHYCSDECACLAEEMGKRLQQAHIPYRTLLLRPAFHEDFEVSLRGNDNQFHSYAYHQVLAVKLAGRWRVIDPLMLGSAAPERISLWIRRLRNRPHYVLYIR